MSPSRRILLAVLGALGLSLAYVLRGVLLPLFLAFLIAYALDPIVKRLQRLRVPRSIGAPLVLLAVIAVLVATIFIAVPRVVDEFGEAARRLPAELEGLYDRTDRVLHDRFNYRIPASWSELLAKYGTVLSERVPDASRIGSALFGTVSAIFVVLGTMIVPVFALYLLGDFDRIIARAASLIPRRWAPSVIALVSEIHETLGRYVRGQLITIVILATLYSAGLGIVGIRLSVPIGVLTGLLAFIPYFGLALGATLAVVMALLDWHSAGQLIGVCMVMGTVGILDAMVITPRIVGGSVGLRPLEVLVTMMGAATLFGFLGVLFAVPLGAVLKILVRHGVAAYLASPFYQELPRVPATLEVAPPAMSEVALPTMPEGAAASALATPGEASIESGAPRG